MNQAQVTELLLQSFAHQNEAVRLYEAALDCVSDVALEEEWVRFLGETVRHRLVLADVFQKLSLDPNEYSLGRDAVTLMGQSLSRTMRVACLEGDRLAAERVACECLVQAETRNHANWEMLGRCAERSKGLWQEVLRNAVLSVEDQVDEHLYRSKGWCRELWLECLGMDSVLPPPEHLGHVTGRGALTGVHAP